MASEGGKSYRDLLVWRKAIALVPEVYTVSRGFPDAERFGLTAQLRRAAVSVPSNIAEGQGRRRPGEFQHFLHIALGSLAEVDTQLEIAFSREFASAGAVRTLQARVVEIREMISGLQSALERMQEDDGGRP